MYNFVKKYIDFILNFFIFCLPSNRLCEYKLAFGLNAHELELIVLIIKWVGSKRHYFEVTLRSECKCSANNKDH